MTPSTAPTTDLDRVIGFTIPDRHARGRVARLGPVLDEILAAHAYPPPIERLLAEALTLTALLGSLLKEAKGQLTLQAQTSGGIVSLLVCDYQNGELRGYVQFDRDRLGDHGLGNRHRIGRGHQRRNDRLGNRFGGDGRCHRGGVFRHGRLALARQQEHQADHDQQRDQQPQAIVHEEFLHRPLPPGMDMSPYLRTLGGAGQGGHVPIPRRFGPYCASRATSRQPMSRRQKPVGKSIASTAA